MKAYCSKIVLVTVMGLILGVACGGEGTTSTGGETTTATTGSGGASTSTTTSSGTSMATGSGGSSTSSSTSTSTSTGTSTSTSTGTSGSSYGTCAPPCTIAADCCPAGDPACPGANYPKNYTCIGGACQSPQCAVTSDCTAQSPKLDCFTLTGTNSCAFACAADTDCNAPQTCSGKDDNGKKFCLATGSGCKDDAFCKGLGIGKCVSGICSCEADTDCTKAGYSKCSK